MHTNHSAIPIFPPNPINYPKYYNAKEKIYILGPGDSLYIPPSFPHWVHSYPDKNSELNENIAFSFPVLYNSDLFNEFSRELPFVFNLNKNDNEFLNFKVDDILQKLQKETRIHISDNNTIIPVYKNTLKNNTQKTLNVNKESLDKLIKSKIQKNMYISQIAIDIAKVPEYYSKSFPNFNIKSYLWMSFCKEDDYIDSGLHWDLTHNILVQVSGIKVVRIFHPSDSDNLYFQPMKSINE